MNIIKSFLVSCLVLFSLEAASTEAEESYKRKQDLMSSAWNTFNSCTSSINDSDLRYIFTNIIALKENPKRYELMQSKSYATQTETSYLSQFSMKLDKCRNPLKTSLFEVDSNLGSLYSDVFNTIDSIVDAYAIGKINLGELNSKLATLELERARSEQEILKDMYNSHKNAHLDESSSNRNRFKNVLRALGEGLKSETQHQRQLEIERIRNERKPSSTTTDCYGSFNSVHCTTR